MNARGTVAGLIGAAKLKIDTVLTIEVEKIVALDKGIRKLGIRDAGAAFADTILNELTIEKLGHRERFADFAEKIEVIDILEPVVIVDHGNIVRSHDALNLGLYTGFIVSDFLERFEVTFAVFLWVADLAGGATNGEIWLVAVADEAGAHHEGGEVTNGEGVSGRISTPIKLLASASV